ncbi:MULTISPECIES: hypothetical protein [unclassified Streptomyces]|uniref:hypothetical protein n=1 Tax=unclassified Streptomyces TaxID=2593676 RepID=UPI003654718A
MNPSTPAASAYPPVTDVSVTVIARAAAALLGDDWTVTTNPIGWAIFPRLVKTVAGADVLVFELGVDEWEELYLTFPGVATIPAHAFDAPGDYPTVEAIAEAVAGSVRAMTADVEAVLRKRAANVEAALNRRAAIRAGASA